MRLTESLKAKMLESAFEPRPAEMTLATLIARLEALKATHGDLPVWRKTRGDGPAPVDGAEFEESYVANPWHENKEVVPDRIEIG